MIDKITERAYIEMPENPGIQDAADAREKAKQILEINLDLRGFDLGHLSLVDRGPFAGRPNVWIYEGLGVEREEVERVKKVS